MASEAPTSATSPWTPFSQPVFRALWIASLASQVGTWMHGVGAAWLMTSLAASPLLVALVQTATSAPLFLLAIPAGALADILDRRKLLLATQLWMLAAAASMAGVTYWGGMTPGALLALTAALAVGAGFNAPAWQATTPDLVPRSDLPNAVALNGMLINLSRVIGPALGGVVIGFAGPAAVFGLNALSFLGVVVVLAGWRRPATIDGLPAEKFLQSIHAGLRYALHAQGYRSVLARTAAFLFPASALWALLPTLARGKLSLGPTGYGALVGTVGLGAVVGTWLLPRIRRQISNNAYTALATLLVAVGFMALPRMDLPIAAGALLALVGVAWIVMLSSLNFAAQAGAAPWARGRALSVFLVFFFGSFALGSAFWGTVAHFAGIEASFRAAAGTMLLGLALVPYLSLASTEGLNLVPSLHWPAPSLLVTPDLERGPVLVAIEYRIPAEHEVEFLELVYRLRASRLRDGAYGWGVFRDLEAPQVFVEVFFATSWAEHLRHHQRVTEDDAKLQVAIERLQTPGYSVKITHRIAARPSGPSES